MERFLRGTEAAEALRIIDTLRDAGFVAYLAGGCVRDALLGNQPKDYDVATDAAPQAVRKVFGKSQTLAFGESFGVIGILPLRQDGARSQNSSGNQTRQPTEVATFRSDGQYSDGRRPDSVHFGDAREDALRRDFTINGLFFDPHEDRVIDYVGGQADLKAGILRTIGDPIERFGEDKLRMLRAVRFATTLGFALDPSTIHAIVEHAGDLVKVSPERIGAEMRRVVQAEDAATGFRHLINCGLDRVVFPETSQMDLDRADRLLRCVNSDDFALRMACFLTLVADPLLTLQQTATNWRLSNGETRRSASALTHWPSITKTRSMAWSKIQPLLVDRDAETIVALAAAIATVDCEQGISRVVEDVATAQEALAWPRERLDPPPLLKGNDLMQIGIPAGPEYSKILRTARDAQLDGTIRTRAEAIARIVRSEASQ